MWHPTPTPHTPPPTDLARRFDCLPKRCASSRVDDCLHVGEFGRVPGKSLRLMPHLTGFADVGGRRVARHQFTEIPQEGSDELGS